MSQTEISITGDPLPVGACKLCNIEDRRIAIFNLVRGRSGDKAETSDSAGQV
jgi:hypothetical protein